MKKLINRSNVVVEEMIDGLLALNPAISRIEKTNVVVRSDDAFDPARKVSLISGGGSGHEPAHAGYVGKGMLSAAVAGPVFTSPSAASVYAAIRAVAGQAGVLLIVKNYTGDRLNFGFAAEQARAAGIAIESVVVADDVALLSQHDRSNARGIAGTVLVHKIAGAAAEAGLSLSEVASIAREASAGMGSMGLSFSAGTSPITGAPSFSLGDGEFELGLGIHGEPGAARLQLAEADSLIGKLVEPILVARDIKAGDRIASLINNLGATTPMELAIAARAICMLLERHGIAAERTYAGTFLTSLDMAGISVSLMRVDEERLRWLDAPTDAQAWPRVAMQAASPIASRIVDSQAAQNKIPVPAGPANANIRTAIQAACEALIQAEDQLTAMDREVGDGDLGTNMSRAARRIVSSLHGLPLDRTAETVHEIGLLLQDELGGSSGPLYGVLFLKAASALGHSNTSREWGSAALAGCIGVSQVGGAIRGDRTMLDALIPFAEALEAGATPAQAAAVAQQAAVETSEMLPKRGRSRYLLERALGHPDPGAVAAAIWLNAVVKSLSAGPVEHT